MISTEHAKPLAAFVLVFGVACAIMGQGLRTQVVDVLVGSGAPRELIAAIAPDMVLGQSLSEAPKVQPQARPTAPGNVPVAPAPTAEQGESLARAAAPAQSVVQVSTTDRPRKASAKPRAHAPAAHPSVVAPAPATQAPPLAATPAPAAKPAPKPAPNPGPAPQVPDRGATTPGRGTHDHEGRTHDGHGHRGDIGHPPRPRDHSASPTFDRGHDGGTGRADAGGTRGHDRGQDRGHDRGDDRDHSDRDHSDRDHSDRDHSDNDHSGRDHHGDGHGDSRGHQGEGRSGHHGH